MQVYSNVHKKSLRVYIFGKKKIGGYWKSHKVKKIFSKQKENCEKNMLWETELNDLHIELR